VCHEKMNMDTRSKRIKAWNEHASMQSRQKACYFVKDSVANGSIARLLDEGGSKTSGDAAARWDGRPIGRFYRDWGKTGRQMVTEKRHLGTQQRDGIRMPIGQFYRDWGKTGHQMVT